MGPRGGPVLERLGLLRDAAARLVPPRGSPSPRGRAHPVRPVRGLPAARARVGWHSWARSPFSTPVVWGRVASAPSWPGSVSPSAPASSRASSDTPTLVTAAPALPAPAARRRSSLLARGPGRDSAAALAVAVALLAPRRVPQEAVGAPGRCLLAARLLARAALAGAPGQARPRRAARGFPHAGVAPCRPRRRPPRGPAARPHPPRARARPGRQRTAAAGSHARRPLEGVAGFVVRYVSHTPAPIFALAAVPLLADSRSRTARPRPSVGSRWSLVLFAVRGRARRGRTPCRSRSTCALAVTAGLALSAQRQSPQEEPRGRRIPAARGSSPPCARAARRSRSRPRSPARSTRSSPRRWACWRSRSCSTSRSPSRSAQFTPTPFCCRSWRRS